MPMARLLVLVPAAGQGERFGGGVAKQLLAVAGRPLVAWTVERLLALAPEAVVVALRADLLGSEIPGLDFDPRIRLVAGGATRRDSVERCLAGAAGSADDLLLVHDAVRPAVALEDLKATLRAAEGADGAVLGRPVTDTLKRIGEGFIEVTVGRTGLFQAETPQIFRRAVLERAFAAAPRDIAFTDEAALVERLEGTRLVAVEASHPNPKLTRPADLPLLEALLLTKEAR